MSNCIEIVSSCPHNSIVAFLVAVTMLAAAFLVGYAAGVGEGKRAATKGLDS